MRTYASVEQFYAENGDRRLSPEHDFGVWWRDSAGGVWRVSWVSETGEVYAIRRGPAKAESIHLGGELVTFVRAGLPETDGPLIVLGTVPASDGECLHFYCSSKFHSCKCPANQSYHVDRLLDGWAEICGAPHSLDWVKERLST